MTDTPPTPSLKGVSILASAPPLALINARPEKNSERHFGQRFRCALPLAGHLSEEALARGAGLIHSVFTLDSIIADARGSDVGGLLRKINRPAGACSLRGYLECVP